MGPDTKNSRTLNTCVIRLIHELNVVLHKHQS
jgi:hypothetical protein